MALEDGGFGVVDSLFSVSGGSVFGVCFVVHCLVSFLALQSSWRGGGGGVCFALIVFPVCCGCWCDSSSRCRGLVCSM